MEDPLFIKCEPGEFQDSDVIDNVKVEADVSPPVSPKIEIEEFDPKDYVDTEDVAFVDVGDCVPDSFDDGSPSNMLLDAGTEVEQRTQPLFISEYLHNSSQYNRPTLPRKRHVCQVCSQSFKKKKNLQIHSVVHKQDPVVRDKRFVCDICERRYSDRLQLIYHIKAHTKKKPHFCKHCDATFGKMESLREHYKSHLAGKFVCTVCGRSCHSRGAMLEHVTVHTSDKPYQCESCGASYKARKTLVKHIRTHAKTD